MRKIYLILVLSIFALLGGCAAPKPYDYSAFNERMPRAIVVLPPINDSPDVKATYGVYATTTKPLAEAGYYVLPVTLVDEAFRLNGLQTPNDIHALSPKKIKEVFGADAGLYLTVKEYGTKYYVVGSASVVTVEAKLIDLESGAQIWDGSASASSEEGKNNQGGLAALLIGALLNQIVGTVVDQSSNVARLTNTRLLSAETPNGILWGARSPNFGKQK
jgi:hypothetical protein